MNCGVDGFWPLTAGNGLTGGTYSLDLTADGFDGVSDFTTLRILKRANALSAWTLDGTHSPGTGSNSIPIVHRTGLSGFSEFGIGSASDNPLPITLASFTARMNPSGRSVLLEWMTLSEINNYGFYVERRRENDPGFAEIPNSFVPGHGTTNEPQEYSFVDSTLAGTGVYHYRLRQVDLDGTIHRTDPISINVTTSSVREEVPHVYALFQNYPNPFNPETVIKFSVADRVRTTLEVYNAIGQQVAILYNDVAEPGQYYELVLDGRSLASGLYFYRLTAGAYTESRKLLLLK